MSTRLDVIPLFHCYVFIFALGALVLRTLNNATPLNCPHWIEIAIAAYPVFHTSFLLMSFWLSERGFVLSGGVMALAASLALFIQVIKKPKSKASV